MKKKLILLCSLMVMIGSLIYFCDPYWLYEDMVPYGNLYYSMHKIANVCRVDYGEWEGLETSLEIEIPDEVNGHRVTVLGDDYPAPFVINIDGVFMACPEELLPEEAQIIPLYLTLRIGANLREIRGIELKDFYQDENDPDIFYQILVNVKCSQDNPCFYSENGKMYKRDGTLVDVFFYESDYR